MNTMVFQCEDTVDGIFTAIYDAWASRLGHSNVKLDICQDSQDYKEQELFTEYTYVPTDFEKSGKVARAIKKKISERAFDMIVNAAVSEFSWKADCIYRFLILGFAMGEQVIHHLTDKNVCKVFEMNRNVCNETHFYREFLRFDELTNKVLFAKYEPKNNITAFVTPHFVDRLPLENFVIFDVKRGLASLHQVGYPWVMTQLEDELVASIMETGLQEDKYRDMWLLYFESIAIESRKNEALQRNLLRLHFRKHMTEFIKKEDNFYGLGL